MRTAFPMPRVASRRLILALTLALALIAGGGLTGTTNTIRASTESSVQTVLLGWINAARAAHKLPAVRASNSLAVVETGRVQALAAAGQLSHAIAGCINCQLSAAGIAWDFQGEILARNSWPLGREAVKTAFDGWMGSPSHVEILMSSRVDTIGIGVAQAIDGTAYVGAILIDAPGYAPRMPRPTSAAGRATPTTRPTAPKATPRPTAVPSQTIVPLVSLRSRAIPF